VGTEKRARQKANRARKIEQVHRVEKRGQRRRNVIIIVALAAGIAAVAYLLSLTGGNDSTPTVAAGCPAADGSSPRTTNFAQAPPTCIDETVTYNAEVVTSLGTFTAELDPKLAPATVNNFVFLARYHYYDGTLFHRVIKDFVIQGGDATGDPPGTGNPGYTIAEEPPTVAADAKAYEIGSVAMAKSSAPNSTGSQFFVVTGARGVDLPPIYSLFGKVTDGLDTVKAIESVATGAGDLPTEPVVINSVTITTN
jgi:cyclophilin family peptidyl-prolyl cis-trans isomerase